MIFSQDGLYELDAHYDRELITINRSMVPTMTWGVQTAFDKAIYRRVGSANGQSGKYRYP